MSATEETIYNVLLIAGFVTAAVVFVTLYFLSAPYGRHGRTGWGPALPPRVGWVLMEIPAALCVPGLIFWGTNWQPESVWISVLGSIALMLLLLLAWAAL